MARPRATEAARRAREEVYRQGIFEAAERVFAEKSFEETKIQEIADAAGLSVGTIYGIFESKAQLYQEVHAERLRELLEVSRASIEGIAGVEKILLEGIGAYVGYLVAHPNYLRMHLRAGESWALGPSGPSSEELQAWREGIELEAAILRQGIDEGIVIDEDPVLLAKTATAMHQVVLSDWIASGMKAPPEAVVQRAKDLVRKTLFRR
ncbi:MAG: TetR/AcrR family transcriptional regulator [Myxococcales bacterium]|nr:TetR/AcrR family transcriptional regulator [Myxococcales bacterium]